MFKKLRDAIKTDEKDINDEIFRNYFKYNSTSHLAKDLHEAMEAKELRKLKMSS